MIQFGLWKGNSLIPFSLWKGNSLIQFGLWKGNSLIQFGLWKGNLTALNTGASCCADHAPSGVVVCDTGKGDVTANVTVTSVVEFMAV